MGDQFIGNWRVTEYVYHPSGEYVGFIHQIRRLEQLENGRLRVYQHCTPSPTLAQHPMATFAGEWVFEMSLDGRNRYYHGADVVGYGWAWVEGVITGKGVWTRFGHNFTSYGVMVTPTRQITGGKFFNAGECIAVIVGVAEPESAEHADFPTLITPPEALTQNARYHGTIRVCNGKGELLGEHHLERHYIEAGWSDHYAGGGEPFVVTLQPMGTHWRVDGTTQGICKAYGNLREIVSVQLDAKMYFEFVDLLDPTSQTIHQLVFGYQDNQLGHVEITRFSY